MITGSTAEEFARQVAAAQQAFWQAAGATGAVADADAFAPPDWQVFDGLVRQLLAEGTDDRICAQAHDAAAAYRDVLIAAWVRVRDAFATHCRAIHDPASPPDWRVLRDRWFDIAEAEFIRTLRTPEFLDAQRGVIRAAARIWQALPEPARSAMRDGRKAAQAGAATLATLGVDMVAIAQTPKETIWQNGKVGLYRYRPLDGQAPRLGPVLICHGLIGRQTMTDLRPDRSLVRNLLAAGVDVFTLDWGDAGPEDAGLGMDHYCGEVLPAALAKVSQVSGVPRPVLFGICQGGTMAACHAASAPGTLAGLILAVAPIDFHADRDDADPAHGLLHVWLRSLPAEEVEALIGMEGNLSGDLLGMIFSQLNPVRTLAKYAIEMVECARDPGQLALFLAMEKWLADRPDLPGAMARTWIRDLYQDNALIAGGYRVAGRPVDLSRIDAPVLNIFATQDHIIPPPCSRALGTVLDGRAYTELALPTGHIGAFVSARAQTLLAPAIVGWLAGLE